MTEEMKAVNLLDSLIEEWFNQFEIFFREIGASQYLGSILSIFLLEDRPITQEELAERLHISQATVSRCIKILNEKWNVISRIRVPESRKWHYVNRKNTDVGIIVSVMVSLLDVFRSHNIAVEGILTQLDSIEDQIKEKSEITRFKTILKENFRSTKLIGEELTKVVKNLQNQYKFS
ncbi:MAG: HTH domain-containing protein [Candidatus Hodarchaeales archaeon]|jgi:DNA-binding transcriptional regulator GbsR (MarR family)